jgi:hypothetical protein
MMIFSKRSSAVIFFDSKRPPAKQVAFTKAPKVQGSEALKAKPHDITTGTANVFEEDTGFETAVIVDRCKSSGPSSSKWERTLSTPAAAAGLTLLFHDDPIRVFDNFLTVLPKLISQSMSTRCVVFSVDSSNCRRIETAALPISKSGIKNDVQS